MQNLTNPLDNTLDNSNSSLWSNMTENSINATENVARHSLIRDEYGNIICVQPTEEEYYFYVTFAWWLEGFGQLLVGILGFIANAIAIPILLSKEMTNVFNRLLSALSVIDNLFIVCSILEAIRKHIGSTKLHTIVFGTFLYQFHNMVLCASTYITVVLALERYKAVWRPVEYRNSVLSGNPWRRVFMYIAPVVILSILFNVPKFFETEFATITIHNVTQFDETLNQTIYVNQTMDVLRASKLKLNSTYALLYSNLARLAVTGFIPLFLLAYFNYRIFTVLKRRRRMNNRPHANTSQAAQQKQEETRQSIMLFAIVIIFVLCHALRIILNVNTLFSLDTIRASINNGCLGEPLWAMIATAFSQFFITVNASINFFIYCFMCEPFRVGLKTQTIKLLKMCFPENIVSKLCAEPSERICEASRPNNHTETSAVTNTQPSSIKNTKQDVPNNNKLSKDQVEKVALPDLPTPNVFKKQGTIFEEEETLLGSDESSEKTLPAETSKNENMEMLDIKEYVSVQSPTKVNFVDAKSQTPHVTHKAKIDNKDKKASLCDYHKKSESIEKPSDENDGYNENKKHRSIGSSSLPNNVHPSNIKVFESNGKNANHTSKKADTNFKTLSINSDTMSVLKDNRSQNPITIFKADYPFFETTL